MKDGRIFYIDHSKLIDYRLSLIGLHGHVTCM